MNNALSSLHRLLEQEKLDALLISSPSTIIYLTGFAGFSSYEREAFLFITKSQHYVITDGRYSEAVIRDIPHFELLERTKDFSDIFKIFINKEKIKHVGFEDENLTVSEYTQFQKYFELYALSLDELRIRKDKHELSHIGKACHIGDEAFLSIQSHIKPGITERELADKLEWLIREKGGTLSFPSIIAFGPNSAIPHHHTGDTTLKEHDIILMDFGVRYNNYCSDMTRTLFIGDVPQEYVQIYQAVLSAQQKAIVTIQESLKQNTPPRASQVDHAAREEIKKHTYTPFSHALGHGIGIDVHEAPILSPRSQQELTTGMVFSIEPGIYLTGKMGVRIEDLFSIQNGKLIQLTNSSKDPPIV